MRILLIDNFDSFTYNLYHYFLKENAMVDVFRNNDSKLTSADFIQSYDAIVLSPGPSNPKNSGYSMDIVAQWYQSKPIFGVCLGMQIINEFFGGKTIKAPYPVHGKKAPIAIIHTSPLFHKIPSNFQAARYHSLICSDVPDVLKVTAIYQEIPMSLEHYQLPIYGVQFHPESFMTEYGQRIIHNFLRIVHERSH